MTQFRQLKKSRYIHMTTILVAFQTTTTPDGQRNWKALDFDFEYQSGEKDFEKFVRLLKKAASYHIGKLKLSFRRAKSFTCGYDRL